MAVVMGVLVISFAIWGIGDIFRGFGLNSAAKVGSTEISIEQFRQFYNDRLQQLGRQLGRPITPEQARALGLDRQVLGQLIAETALDEQAQGIAARHRRRRDRRADHRAIRTSAALNGQFDRTRFEQIIRAGRLHRKPFRRRAAPRDCCAGRSRRASAAILRVPKTAMDGVNRFQNEKRTHRISWRSGRRRPATFRRRRPRCSSKYFEERKVLFRAPEYRKITMVVADAGRASPSRTRSPTPTPRAYYEQHKASYGTPERREVQQIVFPNADEAAAARERIAKGASFDDIAKERGLKDSDIDLGMVTKAASSIRPSPTPPSRSRRARSARRSRAGSAPCCVQVGKIEPGTQKTYDEVAPQIKREIAESAPRPRSATCATRSRTSARPARRSPRPPRSSASSPHHRRGRPLRPRPGRQAGRRPAEARRTCSPRPSPAMSASTTIRCSCRAAAMSGSTSPASRRRATARSTRSRTRSRRAGATTRSPSALQAKADEMVDKLKAGTSLAELASRSRPQGRDGDRTCKRGKPRAASSPAKLIEAVFRTPRTRRQRRRRQADRAGRLPRHRHHRPAARPASADAKRSTSVAADVLRRRHRRRICRAGSKTISASRSTRAALNQVIGGGARNSSHCDYVHADRAAGNRLRRTLRPRARRRWCGPRWSPTWKRRSRPFSRSPAAGR